MSAAQAQSAATNDLQPTGQEWEQEQNLSLNKEVPRATFASFGDLESALKILPENSKYWRSLDGPWKFHWVKRPEERPRDFFKPEFDVSAWREIPVPSSWQCQGYDVPVYVNQAYLFKRDWPRVMGEPPTNFTTFINRNPVGSYRRDFELPTDWAGRSVFINFDGVDSFFYLWLNGHYIGFSKDSRTPAAFDLSPYIQPGRNTLAVEVYRFSDGSYLECQDMWRLSGIFRSVSLCSVPKVHIRDLFVHTEPAADGNWTLSADVALRNLGPAVPAGNFTVAMSLFDAATGKPIAPLQPASTQVAFNSRTNADVTLAAGFAKPALWSAEIPNLYTLVLELKDAQGRALEFVSAQAGFREVEIRDGVYLINGQPVKFKGSTATKTSPTPATPSAASRWNWISSVSSRRTSTTSEPPITQTRPTGITSAIATAFTSSTRPTSNPMATITARPRSRIRRSGKRPTSPASWPWSSGTKTTPASSSGPSAMRPDPATISSLRTMLSRPATPPGPRTMSATTTLWISAAINTPTSDGSPALPKAAAASNTRSTSPNTPTS
jgi:hypothetical protein